MESRLYDLLPKTSSYDKDERYMATSDILAELGKNPAKLDTNLGIKLVKAIIKQLNDVSNDVQSIAVQCIGGLTTKLELENLLTLVTELCYTIEKQKSEFTHDTYCIAMKSIIEKMPSGFEVTISPKLCDLLLQKLQENQTSDRMNDAANHSLLQYIDVLTWLINHHGVYLQEKYSVLCQLLTTYLNASVTVIRKRTITCIGELAAYLPVKLVHDIIQNVTRALDHTTISKDRKENELLVTQCQVLNAVVRNRAEFDRTMIEIIVPRLVSICSNFTNEMEEDRGEEEIEIMETCLMSLEVLLMKDSNGTKPYVMEILSLFSKLLTYDPNYIYPSDDGMEDEEEEENEEEEYENMIEYSDDEDRSWKIRRAAIRIFVAIIKIRNDLLPLLYSQYLNELIGRLKERDEVVRLDICNCISELFETILYTSTAETSAEKAVTGSHEEVLPFPPSVVQRTQVKDEDCQKLLDGSLMLILTDFNKILGDRKASLKTKLAMMKLLQKLAFITPKRMQTYLTDLLLFTQPKIPELKLEILLLFELLLDQSLQFEAHSSDSLTRVIPFVLEALNDAWHKVASVSLRLCSIVLYYIYGPRAHDNASTADLSAMAQSVLHHLSKNNNEELREQSLYTAGFLVSCFGDKLPVDSIQSLCMSLLEKTQNDYGCAPAIKSLCNILSVNSTFRLNSEFAEQVIQNVQRSTHHSSRSICQLALESMIRVMDNNKLRSEISADTLVSLIQSASNHFSDADLHLATLSISLTVVIMREHKVNEVNALQEFIETKVFPMLLKLCWSPLLQEPGLSALANLFYLLRIPKEAAIMHLLTGVDRRKGGLTKETVHSVAQCIAASVLSASAEKEALIHKLLEISYAQGSNNPSDIALLAVGYLAQCLDLSALINMEQLLQLQASNEAMRSACAFTIASLCLFQHGEAYIAVLLTSLSSSAKGILPPPPPASSSAASLNDYLLLNAIKEMISLFITSTMNPTFWTSYRQFHPIEKFQQIVQNQVFPLLLIYSESKDENIGPIVAECIGKSSFLVSETLLAKFPTYFSSPNISQHMLYVMYVAFRHYVIVKYSHSNVTQITMIEKECMEALIMRPAALENHAIEKERLLTLNAVLHHQSQLLQHREGQLFPYLYQCMSFKSERILDLGPFKHTIDDGYEIRKTAYNVVLRLVELLACCEEDILANYVIAGMGDVEDICGIACRLLYQMISMGYKKNINVYQNEILENLEKRLSKYRTISAEGSHSVESVRSVLRIIYRLRLEFSELEKFQIMMTNIEQNQYLRELYNEAT